MSCRRTGSPRALKAGASTAAVSAGVRCCAIGWPVASDNRRYAAVGLPGVGICAGMLGYHSPADTPDRVEAATLTAVARLVVATVWLAVADPATLQSLIGDER